MAKCYLNLPQEKQAMCYPKHCWACKEQSHRERTVGELIEELKRLPAETTVKQALLLIFKE